MVERSQLGLIDVAPLSVHAFERMIERLPIVPRMRLRWLVPRLRTDALALIVNLQAEDLLVAFAHEVADAGRSIGRASAAHLTPSQMLRDCLEVERRAEVADLREQLDAATGDAVEWAFRSWLALIDASQTLVPRLSFVSPSRIQALLVATFEARRAALPPAITREVAYRAYDEAQVVVDELHSIGVDLDPFRGESVQERATRCQRYAAHLRDAFDQDGQRVLEMCAVERAQHGRRVARLATGSRQS